METGLDMIQDRVGREEVALESAVALACACNKPADKGKEEKSC